MRWLNSERPERSAPVRVPGPSAAVWLGALLLAVAWLLAVLVCATYPQPTTIDGSWLHRAWLTLRGSPIALTIAAFVGLIAALYFVRRLILRRHAWRPGPIEVPDFATDAPASAAHGVTASAADTSADAAAGTPQESAGPPIARLSMQFRERLAAVHLQAPEAFPAAPEAQDFLQLLTGAVRAPANVLGTIAGLLASALPRSAYRVRGTLLQREGAEPFGVEVHVVTAPHYASPPLFFWAVSWDVAVERAAYAVAAYLLPRTRACRQPPWTGWQGIEAPRRLVGYGTRASEAARARQYERALDLYFKALAEDPRNLELRLETGLVQEKLALWLDAFATYDDLVAIADNSPAPFRLRVRKRTAWRAQRRIVLLARYRRAILLGFGERLAHSWCRAYDEGNELRRSERAALLTRLRPVVERALERLRATSGRCVRDPAQIERILDAAQGVRPPALAGAIGAAQITPTDEVRLREVFAQISELELRALARDVRKPGTLWNSAGLTRRSVLMAAACADLRRRRNSYLLSRGTEPLPRPDKVDQRVQRRLLWMLLPDWQARYNAACTYAVLLLKDDKATRKPLRDVDTPYTSAERERLTVLAIAQLKRAIAQLDSGSLSRRSTWIVRKDPDLAGLRGTSAFRALEARYLPQPAAPVARPSNVDSLELILHAARLLVLIATALADEWRGRAVALAAHDGDGAGALLRTWLEQEEQVVTHFVATARDHRHWQTRAATLRELERWAAGNGRVLPSTHYRDYGDDPLPCALAAHEQDAERFERRLGKVLGRAAEVRARVRYEEDRCDHHAAWLDAVKRSPVVIDGDYVCLDRAHLWEWLTGAIEQPTNGNGRTPPLLSGPVVSGREVRPRRTPG